MPTELEKLEREFDLKLLRLTASKFADQSVLLSHMKTITNLIIPLYSEQKVKSALIQYVATLQEESDEKIANAMAIHERISELEKES